MRRELDVLEPRHDALEQRNDHEHDVDDHFFDAGHLVDRLDVERIERCAFDRLDFDDDTIDDQPIDDGLTCVDRFDDAVDPLDDDAFERVVRIRNGDLPGQQRNGESARRSSGSRLHAGRRQPEEGRGHAARSGRQRHDQER